MKKDYVKAKKVSERVTGDPMKIRHTTSRYKKLLDDCNDSVEAILDWHLKTPVTYDLVVNMINNQNLNKIQETEILLHGVPRTLLNDDEIEALKLIENYLKARKEVLNNIEEKAQEIEGIGSVEYEIDGFKAIVRIEVSHKFLPATHDQPACDDMDYNIIDLKITL